MASLQCSWKGLSARGMPHRVIPIGLARGLPLRLVADAATVGGAPPRGLLAGPPPCESRGASNMKTVAGMFETRSEAEDAIHRLQAAGFSRDAIGVAMRDTSESSDLATTTG